MTGDPVISRLQNRKCDGRPPIPVAGLEDDLIVEIAEGIQVRVARRAVGGVVKPDEEGSEDDEHDEDAPEAAVHEDDVVDSEEIVKSEDAEDTAALERR